MPEWSKLAVWAVLVLGVAVGAIRDAARAGALGERRSRDGSARPDAGPDHPAAEAALVVPPAPATVPRQWLLDALPVEPPLPRRARAAGAGRLLIGIAGMGIVGAAALLGLSRAISALLDRFLR